MRSFWVSPREHPDFAWAFVTRLLVNLGNWIALNYLYYFLTDGLGYGDDDATGRLGLLVLIYGVATVATTVVVGHWSDRIGRRKVFVIASGGLIGVSSLVLGLWQDWPGALLAAVVLGAGFGVYQAVDFALITQVLSGAGDRAKDLGVIEHRLRAAAGPRPGDRLRILVLVRLGGSVATRGESWSLGYGVVYLVGFVLCVLGSVFVTRIRSVAEALRGRRTSVAADGDRQAEQVLEAGELRSRGTPGHRGGPWPRTRRRRGRRTRRRCRRRKPGLAP